MKLQHLGVLFVIIILPIVIVTSMYIQTQIDTVVLQTTYDSRLMNATHDAIKAFQINQSNSNTTNAPEEKLRDVKASINTFYNSLATSMGTSGFTEEDLNPYIPALVYTLYDGYYMYLPFYNELVPGAPELERNVKPYIYYSARYRNSTGSIDIIVNYTLDNYMTIYGKVNGETGTYSGYFIDYRKVQDSGTTITYDGVNIDEEELSEVDKIGYNRQVGATAVTSVTPTKYKYVSTGKKTVTRQKQREKIYWDDSTGKWYTYTADKYQIDASAQDPNELNTFKDNSAQKYYKEAKEFSEWVHLNLGTLTEDDIQLDNKADIFPSTRTSNRIFEISDNNNPERETSSFNIHKREVIKNSIQTNLYAAMAAYNRSLAGAAGTTYNFKMPELTEPDWDKILNNVSMISFMQGLPIKNKYYVGYSIVTNTKSREYVDPRLIYMIDGSQTYHDVTHWNGVSGNLIGYRNIDFDIIKVSDENQARDGYYLPHAESSCYECIVAAKSSNTIQEALDNNPSLKKAYYTALARERYNNYKTNNFDNNFP